jgi:hypothetical protein
MMKDLIIFEGWQLLIDRAKRFFNVVVIHSERQKPGNSPLLSEAFSQMTLLIISQTYTRHRELLKYV